MYDLRPFRTYPGLSTRVKGACDSLGIGNVNDAPPWAISAGFDPAFAVWMVRALKTTPSSDSVSKFGVYLCDNLTWGGVACPDFKKDLDQIRVALDGHGELGLAEIRMRNIRRGNKGMAESVGFALSAARLARDLWTDRSPPAIVAASMYEMVGKFLRCGQDGKVVTRALRVMAGLPPEMEEAWEPPAQSEPSPTSGDLWSAVLRVYLGVKSSGIRSTHFGNILAALEGNPAVALPLLSEMAGDPRRFPDLARIAKLPDDKFQSLVTLLEVL